MKNSIRLSIPGILLILLGGFLPSAAHAGPSAQSGAGRLVQIKSNPCNGGNEGSVGGGRTAFLCNGWRGVQGMIDVPVRTWTTSPEYPLAGVPFKIGIGVDQDSLSTQFPSSDITFPGEIRFFDYRTEIRLVPVKLDSGYFGWNFNGILDYDDSIFYTPSASARDWYGAKLAVPLFYEDPIMSSASNYSHEYYPTEYIMAGDERVPIPTDKVVFGAYSSMSSYHAVNPSTFKGEPAFRLEVTSYYLVQARARWDSYQVWKSVVVGEKTECRPGPSSGGNIECMAIVGGWWQPGHYVTVPIYDYQWGAAHGAGSTDWVLVDKIDTNKVAWPDGSIHDHIPILIYQAQPLLQKP